MEKGQLVRVVKFKEQSGRIKVVLPEDDYDNKYVVLFNGNHGKKYGIFKERDLEKRSDLINLPKNSEVNIYGGLYNIDYKEYDPVEERTKMVLRQIQGPELDKIVFLTEDDLIEVEFELVRRAK